MLFAIDLCIHQSYHDYQWLNASHTRMGSKQLPQCSSVCNLKCCALSALEVVLRNVRVSEQPTKDQHIGFDCYGVRLERWGRLHIRVVTRLSLSGFLELQSATESS